MISSDLQHNFKTNIRFKEICIGLLSRYYPWDLEQIEEFRNIINFEEMMFMKNDTILWSFDLIELLKNKMDWGSLWKTKGLELNLDFFERYEGYIDFSFIHHHNNIDWSYELLDKYKDKWDWKGLSFKAITANPRNIEKYGDLYDWNDFSANKYLVLNKTLLDKYLNKWNWKKLCANSKLIINGNDIIEYEDYINWSSLSKNPSMIPFILAFPEKYEWNWISFVQNPGVIFGKNLKNFLEAKFKKKSHPNFDDAQKNIQAKRMLQYYASFRLDFNRDEWSQDGFLNFIQIKQLLKWRPDPLTTEEIEEYLDLNEFDRVLSYKIVRKLSRGYVENNLDRLLKYRWSIFRYGRIDQEFFTRNSVNKDYFQLAFNELYNWDLNFLINNLNKFESNYGLSQNKKIFELLFGNATNSSINSLLREY